MSWIKTIPYSEATGRLKALYERVKGADDNIDNIMMAHSLRPHTMEGHMRLYKNVLHHTSNSVPKWRLELMGVWVSLLNGCAYCVEHHHQGLRQELDNPAKADEMRSALERDALNYFDAEDRALLAYAFKLTTSPSSVERDDVVSLRDIGLSDGEILEINQVIAYFAYANRTVLGLGVDHAGDVLGRAPRNSADGDDWSHE